MRHTEPLRLRTEDGVRIDACHQPPADGATELGIVVAHGFSGSWRQPRQRRIAGVLAGTAGVVCLDFRGHGRSGGHSTVGDREILDVAAAVAAAREFGYRRVATLGFSMGASVTLRHAGLIGGIDAIAAVSGPGRWYFRGTPPMRRLHWVVEDPVGRLVGRLLLGIRIGARRWADTPRLPMDLVDAPATEPGVPAVAPAPGVPAAEPANGVPVPPAVAAGLISPTPLLIVHGDRDPYFPVGHAHGLYDAARHPKQLWIERGYGHAEGAATPRLIHRIAAWLRDAAAGSTGD
ncbi:MAG: alpha/beta hydrolase [Micromonosporaceae bacterium]